MNKWICLTLLALSPFSTDANELLASINVSPEYHGNDFDRVNHFGKWIDEDGDGQDTRQEVLASESLIPVTWNHNKKKVIAGLWYDPFTGKTFTHPNRFTGNKYAILQIDHLVPLKEAWQSGAKSWTKEKRVKFANDMSNGGHLIAVSGGSNASKGPRDPGEWLPPNERYHCAYVYAWTTIKHKWGLSMDQKEFERTSEIINNCEFEN